MDTRRRLRPPRPSTAPEKAAEALLPAAMLSLPEEPLNINLDTLPPPFDLYPRPSESPSTPETQASDWATFITAYACGRWDPQRIPRPPRASLSHGTQQESTQPVPKGALAFELTRVPPPPPSHRLRASFSTVSSAAPSPAASTYPPLSLPGAFPFPPASASPSLGGTTSISNTTGLLDAATSAATLRWAGARVRVAPLALPSPEHELTDPMRGAGAVPIPGSHPPELFPSASTSASNAVNTPISTSAPPMPLHIPAGSGWSAYAHHGAQTPGWDVMTPGGTRRSRLSGFWSGTADVDSDSGYTYSYSNSSYANSYSSFGGGSMLPTIDASPATPDGERDLPARSVPVPRSAEETASAPVSTGSSAVLLPRRPPPATAPMRVGMEEVGPGEEGDYFGVAATAARLASVSAEQPRRSGRSSGLRTPPRTREGSASGSVSPERSPSPAETRSGSHSRNESREDKDEVTPTQFSTGTAPTPTTPDSNPARPELGRTVSGPATTTPDSNPAPTRPGALSESGPHSADTVLLAHATTTTPVDEEAEDPTAFSSNSSLANAASAPPSPSAGAAPTEGARPVLPHASTLGNPSAFSTVTAPYGPTSSSPDHNNDPFDATTYAYAYAQSVPVRPPPRRAGLTRQMSVPLPTSASGTFGTLGNLPAVAPRALSSDPGRDARVGRVDGHVNGGAPSENGPVGGPPPTRLGPSTLPAHRASPAPRRSSREDARAVREERAFAARAYLAPPYPPDELGRRRALYKFNIMHTGPDLAFDRIAHLAKLVFNTKGVVISVVDGEEEWFKSEWGMSMRVKGASRELEREKDVGKAQRLGRAMSFCGHAILQRGDEPIIVLDSRLDWRFAKNPLVTGTPNIRFYAGAPLRTQDGFNIGALALIDDAPREDFTPRQRHTLKEFAAIAMREMELWKDKIQLRIRDRIQNSMEQFSRECLEIDSEAAGQGHAPTLKSESKSHQVLREPNADSVNAPPPPPHANNHHRDAEAVKNKQNDAAPHKNDATRHDPPDLMGPSSSMDTVYDRAAKLVQRTLDVEGVVVMDVSHCEVLETMNAEATVSVVLHHGDPDVPTSTHTLSAEEYARLYEFFARYPEGKISEGIVPPTLRVFLPMAHIQYALVVPIYNIDKRPFALLCAWNASDQSKRFLEGHELSYLRAIGVIILSAVLKRRMILADKAKSLFISNISHELRTPLHGILAAAELLGDSPLNHSQRSFLETVQACGNSLVETVNHVLDFTKLSGNSKAGGVENVIIPTKVDLMQLIEEAVDGCWIGHRARTAIMDDTGIGSVYSPPEELSAAKQLVETVVDIGWRKGGWSLKCEKGGIRRVLMNVFGNSLKFTTNGYVHVILRELPRSGDEAPNETKVELVVLDTGKGISENFRKNQLFHPFSQENPLQMGTGLGLAIVNSIVKSESVNGKVDVWSEEGFGTEIKVTFTAQIPVDEAAAPEMEPFKFDDPIHPVTVSLVGFEDEHKGVQLLHNVIRTYLVSWWGFEVRPPQQDYGEIVILNEDVEPVKKATAERNTSRPFIILSTLRGNPGVMAIASEHERCGGFCRIIYKPGGPSRLYALLKLCLHAIKIGRSGGSSPHQYHELDEPMVAIGHVPRRNSEETRNVWAPSSRPMLSQRSSTAHPLTTLSWQPLSSTAENEEPPAEEDGDIEPTVSIGASGTILRSSMGAITSAQRRFRVLVVEDNSILRNLLAKWLTTRGYDYRDAVDGRNGVKVYEEEGPFDVVLLDMSMPILDGIGATTEIRQMEARRRVNDPDGEPTRILALTGMSSLEDKRKAFEAGVDGYLIKPVAFKTLEEMFSKLGVS